MSIFGEQVGCKEFALDQWWKKIARDTEEYYNFVEIHVNISLNIKEKVSFNL